MKRVAAKKPNMDHRRFYQNPNHMMYTMKFVGTFKFGYGTGTRPLQPYNYMAYVELH